MKTLENESDKINKICEILKKEALEPAGNEAAKIIQEAKIQADKILEEAKNQAQSLRQESELAIAKEKQTFQANCQKAAMLTLENLRQTIDEQLFQPALANFIEKGSNSPNLIAEIIQTILQVIKKEGVSSNLVAYIPKEIKPDLITHHLLAEIFENLHESSLKLGNFKGGAVLKLVDKHITLDISDFALKELIGTYIAKDLRKTFFI